MTAPAIGSQFMRGRFAETEHERLRRLALVDAPPEQILDRLSELARRRLGSPVALVSIVQFERGRQYFKSTAGLEGALAAVRQTPLSHSFCRLVRRTEDPLVVVDSRQDPRVRDNPAVKDFGVIAYLGCPIRLTDGKTVGALCVFDTVPRAWSDVDVAELSRLADYVSLAISFREMVGELEAAECHPDPMVDDVSPVSELLSPDLPCGVARALDPAIGGGAAGGEDICGRAAHARPVGRAPVAKPAHDVPQIDAQREVILAGELWQGIARGEFQPWYQPQVDAHTRAVVGAEMLVRWCKGDGRILAPGCFLELADRLGILLKLDRQVIRRALAEFGTLAVEGHRAPVPSINLTRDALFDGEVLRDIKAYRAAGSPLSAEILESVSLEDPNGALDYQLDQLREAGVPIGLDDFGSSRASVLSLVRVRPDFVKFDGRLVDALTQPKVAPEALSAFAVLAHDCGASVIAEGVETASQADLLRDLGCDFLQGFHFARPMPAAALRELLTVDRP